MAIFDLPPDMQVFERGWLSANNILFTGGEQSVLIDSGYCTHSDQTLALVEAALHGRELDLLVNTHLHSDHCGGNAALQSRYQQLETLIPPGQAKLVQDWNPLALTYQPTGQLCPRFIFSDTLQPGSVISFGVSQWEIHAASGHDPHSVVFFEPIRKVLISADALWQSGFGVVFPELEGEQAFSDVAATLSMIETLAPLTVIPGHGPVFAYTPQVLAVARDRLSAFIKSPERHARHAAKVLLKFKLLELQQVALVEFRAWASATTHLRHIQNNFFSELDFEEWVDVMIAELVRSNAARVADKLIVNI